MMKVFVSWSGDKSKRVAQTLRDYFPAAINALDLWMSDTDINPGDRWSDAVATELDQARVGIICVTMENRNAEWILFESGALSRKVESPFVCPYLFDCSPGDLARPLSQFQSIRADKAGTYKLLSTLNRALGPETLADDRCRRAFDLIWRDMEPRFNEIAAESPPPQEPSEKELLREIYRAVRQYEQGPSDRSIQELSGKFGALNKTVLDLRSQFDVERAIRLLAEPSPSPEDLQQSRSDLHTWLKEQPLNRRLNIVLANLHDRLDDRAGAIVILERFVDSKTRAGEGTDLHTADALYNLACFYAMESKKEGQDTLANKALALLGQSIRLRPQNASTAATDSDLDAIRNQEQFQKLINLQTP